ncbi:hypothetical protein PULV_a0075 [Pseudoalteromonas ulvae UL12]|uniref:Phosphate ABC transporter substrate-binding protein n=1 Tax=Pseudoalteromonas ulvae TaxID=107327 RepID=A0A244CVA2_PSEDV|nr:substrate-binding domain-containing protein [Pseudoalteromonas ulvae]MBE0362559.1 hypothetical protein [Pseudoalteromonas ulvae UL12]OUL59484.1 phosphate ABC transporter substrate-binding protein [Pseudoalteromonas ulvae]
MKKLSSILILSCCSWFATAEVAIVVNTANANSLDQSAIAKIYLGKSKSFPSGDKIEFATLDDGHATTEEFNDKVLKKSSSQVNAYWSKLVFTGKGTPPKKLENDAAMLQFVASNPNAIGFVDAGKVDDSVKVIATF